MRAAGAQARTGAPREKHDAHDATSEALDGSSADGAQAASPGAGAGAGGGAAAAAQRAPAGAGAPHSSHHSHAHSNHHKGLKTININLAACKYSVLRIVARKLGWVEVDDEADWHVAWTDTSAGCDRLMRMRRPQKLNHFPGMLELARKKSLARNLGRMRDAFPAHYDFFPRTFLLPEQGDAFMAELAAKGPRSSKTFIMKLDNGSQGRGIKLVQSVSAATAAIPTFEHPNIVASQYVANPFLVNGYKFDLRIYVLVRSCDPLRVFIHNEGLVRFCTEPYQPPRADNLGNNYAHLTNYAVNKRNPNFVFNKDAQRLGDGSKWSITALAEWMGAAGYDWGRIWGSIKHMIAKSLVAIQPILQYHYRASTKQDDDGFTCFEVLGYDVLLDSNLRPWLLEVNHSPSFTVDTPLDLLIKERLITETMGMVGISVAAVKEELLAREAAKLHRLYSAHQMPGMPCTAGTAGASHHPPHSQQQQQQQQQPASPGKQQQLPPQQQPQPQQPQSEQQQQQAGPSGEGLPAAGSAGAAVAEAATTAAAAAAAAGDTAGGAPAGVTADWEAAQRRHEEANMGHFERIIPSDNPEEQALYEELQAGARQVFYKQTMQGRLQHALEQMKERRQHEEAEAAAKAEAHRRRVESLKAWMSTVYVKAREQRERADREKQELELHKLEQLGRDQSPEEGLTLDDSQGRQGGSGCCSSSDSGHYSDQLPPGSVLLRNDSACTRSSHMEGESSGDSSYSSGTENRGGAAAAASLGVQGVPSPRSNRCTAGARSCPTSPMAGVATKGPPRSAAWASKQQRAGRSGRPQGGGPGSSLAGGTQGRGEDDCGADLLEDYELRGGKIGSPSRCQSALGGFRGSPEGIRTYIPPAMMSALHSVNLGAQLARAGGEATPVLGPSRCQSPAPRAHSALHSRGPSRRPASSGAVRQERTAAGRAAPAVPWPLGAGKAPSPRLGSAGLTRSNSNLASSTAALQAEYMRQIEKQAVKSIADMIAGVLGK